MLENINAVIFDLDGTIVDSMWVWTAIDEEYVRNYQLELPQNFHKAIEGMSYTETAQYFLDTFPQLTMSLETLKSDWTNMAFKKYTEEVSLKEGMYEFLKDLQERGIRMGIATSNGRELVEAVMKAKGVDCFFSCVVTSCEVNAGKPAPDVYLKAAKYLKTEPEHCLVFEDVPMGILAGKNAGMKVCAVEDAFSKPQEAKKEN